MRSSDRRRAARPWAIAAAFFALTCAARAAAPAEIEADGYLLDYQAVNCKAIDGIYDDSDPAGNAGDLMSFYVDQNVDRMVFRVGMFMMRSLDGRHDEYREAGARTYVLVDYRDGGTMELPDGIEGLVPVRWDVAVRLAYDERGEFGGAVFGPDLQEAARPRVRSVAVVPDFQTMECSIELPDGFRAAVARAAGVDEAAYDSVAREAADLESTPVRYHVVTVVDGEVADEISATNEPRRGDHNVAFVQHGNQGLTYTTVFWGVKGEHASYAGDPANPDDGFDEILDAHDYYNLPGNFHMAGTLMTGAEWHDPAFNDSIQNGVAEGWAQMVTSAYAQHIMPFVYDDMNSWSVDTERDMVNYRYGQWPRVAWVPERVWCENPDVDGNGINASCCVNDYIGDDFLDNGVEAVILDDYVHCGYLNDVYNDHHVYSYNGLKIIPIDNDFVGQMNYDAGAAMSTIYAGTSDEIIVYGNDWEVAAEVAGFDVTHPYALENYIYVLQQCSIHSDQISVWNIEAAADVFGASPTPITLQNGTYGLLGEWYGYGGGCNQWYCDWAGYAGENNLDAHTPKWDYEAIWQNTYNKIVTGPNNGLSQAAWYVMMSMLHETGWHDAGQIADWENRYSNHIKNANVYAEAARWAEGWGSYGTTPVNAYLADFDEDGADETVIYNDRLMAVFESIGGKANWVFAKGPGYAYSVVGNCNVYWADTNGDWNETNHVAALSDVSVGGIDREHDTYDPEILDAIAPLVSIRLTHSGGAVSKVVNLSLGDPYMDIVYDAGGDQTYIKHGWTPDLVDLVWDTEHYRVWDPEAKYAGQRNTSSGATAAVVMGEGGASHNLTQTATLLEVDEIVGTGQFEYYLYAGETSAPVGDEIAELEALAAGLTDVLPPRPIVAHYYPSADRLDITFNELMQYDNAVLTGVGIDEDDDGVAEVTLTAGASIQNTEDSSVLRILVTPATADAIEALTPGTLEAGFPADSFFDIAGNGNAPVTNEDDVRVIYGADTKITIDGLFDAGEWAPYTLVVDDPDSDSAWHPPEDPLMNELYGIRVDWDADFLYVGINGQVQSNSWILYLDTDPGGPGGETDLTAIDTWERGATFTASGFRADFQYGCYQHQGAFDSSSFFSIDSPTTTTALSDSIISAFDSFHDYGASGGSEMAIPWHVLYGLAPGQVPPNAELSLVCSICWDPEPDGQLGGDSAPSNTSASLPVIDAAYTVIVDHDGDGLPDEGATGVPADEGALRVSRLLGNRPNPFNPLTEIAFAAADGSARTTLAIYDLAGRLVATLVDGVVEGGEHRVVWDGRGDDGERLASGVYFARLTVGEEIDVAKMIMLK
jgi:hypothetical protein